LMVRPRISLGRNYVSAVQAGSSSARVVRSDFTVLVSQTAIPVQLDQVLDVRQHGTRANLISVVHELALALDHGGSRALSQNVKEWAPAFREGAIAAEAARGSGPHDLSLLIADAERSARALAPDHAELADLVTGLDRTAEALAARRLALEASVPEFAGVLREALPTFIELNELFPTARAFAREVRPGLRE